MPRRQLWHVHKVPRSHWYPGFDGTPLNSASLLFPHTTHFNGLRQMSKVCIIYTHSSNLHLGTSLKTFDALQSSGQPAWQRPWAGVTPLPGRPTSPHPPPVIAGRSVSHSRKGGWHWLPQPMGRAKRLWLKDLPGLQNKPVCCVLTSRDGVRAGSSSLGHWLTSSSL